MVYLNGVHFGHIQTDMLLIHISRTFLESLGIGKSENLLAFITVSLTDQ